MKDSTIVKDAIPYNRNLVLKQINKLSKHFKDGNKDLKDIERDYRNHNIIYSYNNNVDFYEGDELVAAVNPSKVKKNYNLKKIINFMATTMLLFFMHKLKFS